MVCYGVKMIITKTYENIEVEGQNQLFYAFVYWGCRVIYGHGADADGNRGTRKVFFDILSIEVYAEDGNIIKDEDIIDTIANKLPEPTEDEFE
jgi:hypothetical protein